MKKMLSLAAMFAVLASASTAQAELKLGGDASVRVREDSYAGNTNITDDNLSWQYRVRLNASADLGDGYFFKTMITNENDDGGWVTSNNIQNEFSLSVSNFYFGRMLENCHYMAGRLPLNSFNNPIFDITLFPTTAVDNPVYNIFMDRAYGLNYGTKIGNGMLNATLVVLDDASTTTSPSTDGDGIFNDGYALHLDYKVNVGNVTLEPQFLTVLTNGTTGSQPIDSSDAVLHYYPIYAKITPWTVGGLVGVPAGDLKLTFGAFYTACNDTTPNGGPSVDYNGYLFRVKGEIGNFMISYDYNRATDKVGVDTKHTNNFIWAQYKIPVYSSAMGSVTLQPTLRYTTNKAESNGTTYVDQQRLRSELWATVTF
ncbi:porin [Chlorobaculum sp. MV4-Y]|uniref:porin n=1 Tax=Chlorobaculum sp. MV4-Y TaxID=2976335 RepID=UPI0021B07EA3|nr:porin [Chlorobaculum sp. MV4-Y]UWX57211.1 porin [Chlorobaculum sp. MV4-Y]